LTDPRRPSPLGKTARWRSKKQSADPLADPSARRQHADAQAVDLPVLSVDAQHVQLMSFGPQRDCFFLLETVG
jgi:hypothetical protein